MSNVMLKPAPMSAEDYLAWHVTQPERYEYVDGVPQLKHVVWDGPRMMVGATQAHIRLSFNVARELDRQLRGHPCSTMPADGKVVTPKGNYRYPDVAVDCGPYMAQSTILSEPTVIVEIWSKTTRWIDLTLKLDDYRSVASIKTILFLSQDKPNGHLWTRGQDWSFVELEGLDAEAVIAEPALTLPFRTIYDGLDVG